jgi:hypothetical protein
VRTCCVSRAKSHFHLKHLQPYEKLDEMKGKVPLHCNLLPSIRSLHLNSNLYHLFVLVITCLFVGGFIVVSR